jgi:hypothetical protein
VVRKKVATQRKQKALYATFCGFFLFNFQELIETIDKNAEEALIAVAGRELAFLKQFGQPLLPFQRERREAYEYQEQFPSDHIENLERYLLIVSLLVSKDSALNPFRIRHPDLQPGNVIVSRSPDSNQLKVVGLLDWRHASILPLSLLAGIPAFCRTTTIRSRRPSPHPHCRRT